MEELRVAIQGIQGSFHDEASRTFFKDINVSSKPCDTFEDLFDRVQQGDADVAAIAIENTVAGSLLPNYTLLNESGFVVFGELYLRISQHLMAIPGQSIDDIREACSHHMAIAQTRKFFKAYPQIRLKEAHDTAGSAKEIADHNLSGVAAIAGKDAARLFGLEILAEGIEANKRNFTSFLFLYKPNGTKRFAEPEPDKASISFSLPHHTGSLSQVLSVLSFYGINLTKIQSIPIIGQEWEYHFLIDLTFEDQSRYHQSLDAIRPLTREMKILDEYKQGNKVL